MPGSAAACRLLWCDGSCNSAARGRRAAAGVRAFTLIAIGCCLSAALWSPGASVRRLCAGYENDVVSGFPLN